MDKKILYRKAYRALENVTPLKYNCGMLCKSKCCTGNSDSGMHLYPGEEFANQKAPEFLSIRNEDFGHMSIHFAVCNGECNRKYRPLACRIYPLVPYIDSKGKFDIIEDPRASRICPMLVLKEDYPINSFFKHRVKSIFQLLIQDHDIKSYIDTLSDVLREYSLFTGSELS